ncbi:MAG: hypothetical protein KFF73_14905 [Cyclobacteriaceae bacterium]|nr:hypothetical protein [Cyclobacteriaceae bacterium]
MKKYGLYILLISMGILISYLILADFLKTSVKKRQGNPYAYNIEAFKKIDPDLVKYAEIRRIRLSLPDPVGINYHQGKLGIAYKHAIQLIDTLGREVFNQETGEVNTCVSFSPEGKMFLASGREIHQLDPQGTFTQSWKVDGEDPIITALAFKNNQVLAASAGQWKVLRFDEHGTLLDSFDGTGRLEGDYGFILPSPYFDMQIDPDGELWVANTGLLTLENYAENGTLRAFWGKPSFDVDGFTGCCNPVHFAILPDGSFVTSEKGLIRIKIHLPSGEFDCLVAGPEDFEEDSEPPDLAVDENGRIFVLDITRSMIRIYKRNNT